jgi:hypothetical protein
MTKRYLILLLLAGALCLHAQSACPNPQPAVPIVLSSATGYVQVVPPQTNAQGAPTTAIICRLIVSVATAGNISIAQGTGTNCGTNTTALSGNMANGVTLVLGAGPPPIQTSASGLALCLNFSATVTGGGFVIYGHP